MTKQWSKYNWERIVLGTRRYLMSCLAFIRHMVIFPLRYPGKTNSFARGTLALQDELNYNDRRIPLIDAWTLFPGIETTDVSIGRLLPDEGSSISFREMIVLCSIVRVEHAHTIFEIGTSMGVTAFNLALNLPEGGTLFTVDLPFVQPGAASVETTHEVSISDRKMIFSDRRARRFVGSPIESRVSPLYGDSATFDFTRYKGQCDIVFVDGAHSLAYVAQDTETAFELARPGGLVLWHDYNDGHFWPDVQRHLVKVAQQHRIHRIRGTMIAVARTALN